jgi:YbgC/YbaW family acyl-CoA thioester hydrolase
VVGPRTIRMRKESAQTVLPGSGVSEPLIEPLARHPGEVVVRGLVRWSDVDAAGIVCFGRYLRYFEAAETELFRRVGLPAQRLRSEHGLWLVRRRVECDFLRPLALDTEIDIAGRVVSLGGSSVQLRFAVRVGECLAPYAEGAYVCVAVDTTTLEPVELPARVRAALEPYLLADDRSARRPGGPLG